MRQIENRCCDCAVPGYPCKAPYCSNLHYEAIYCDRCGDEMSDEKNYGDGDEDICFSCHENEFKEKENGISEENV